MIRSFYLVVLFATVTTNAYAYIDAGSSLLVLQGIFAFIGAALVFIRHPISACKSAFHRIKNAISSKTH